jgi:hypothetical protein
MSAPMNLAAMLAPLPLDAFLGTIWGRSYHYGKANGADRFAGLLPDRRLEELLATLRPQPDMLRLVKQGQILPFEELLLPDGMVDMVQLRKRYADGYTIVLNGAERFAPELRMLTNAIAAEVDFQSQINVYTTPPFAQGFTPHFDDHDVLVLHLRGVKTWHVHLSTPIIPPERFRQRERAVDPATLGEPERIELAPGDVLYLPRGTIHAAESTDSATVHLTIGIHPPTLLGLLTAALEARGRKGGALLERVPPRYLSDSHVRTQLAGLVRGLGAALENDDVAQGLYALQDQLVQSGRGAVTGEFIGAGEAAAAHSLQDMLRRSTTMPVRLIDLGEAVGLQFAQALVVAEADHRPAFDFLLAQQGCFRVGDLPGLAPAAQAALAEKLVQDGFLTASA